MSFSRSNLEKWTAGREDELVHVKLLAVLAGQAQVRVLLVHPQLPGSRPNEKSVLRKGDRLSPEVALGVVLELLPVEPVLVGPHSDFNLPGDRICSIFTLLSVCMLGRHHRSRRVGECVAGIIP